MVPRRLHVRVLSGLIVILGLANLIFLFVNLFRSISSLTGSSISGGDIPMLIVLYFSQLASISVCAVVTAAIRPIFKPYKYWMDLACNAFAIGMFVLMFFSGLSSLIVIIIYKAFESTTMMYAVLYLILGIAFFALGIVASKLVLKRRRPAGFFYMGIIVLGTLIYLVMYFTNGSLMNAESHIANILFIILLGLECAYAIINAFTIERPEELDNFLSSIEHRHPKLYQIIVKNYSGQVNTPAKPTAPASQEVPEGVEENDEFVERTWVERGMLFSNKE